MKNILVVGGAGYIGAYMCKYLAKNGFHPIVLDNFVCGHRQAVRWGSLVEGSMADRELLKMIFSARPILAVMHFAAFCYVGESVDDPAAYYRNNVSNTLSLLEAMIEHKVTKFIFSSSCATYGEPIEIPINEEHPQKPINPYGRSKHMVEQMLEDFRHAYRMDYVSLRYFNAAGADPEGELGEDRNPETHLIPLIFQAALGRREAIRLFGDDYPTRDGTCIRDYIHIDDLAQAHLLSLMRILNRDDVGEAYNLGNGDGYSVMEVIEAAQAVTGKAIPYRIVERRPGDPAILVSSSRKAVSKLGWKPNYPDLGAILETAWNWHRRHPDGYDT